MKPVHTYILHKTLPANPEFISALSFEAYYAAGIRGGNLPAYLNPEKRKRLVNAVNFLAPHEKQTLIQAIFSSNN